MKTGRPRKPTALKILQGTAQPCRINKKEPRLKAEIPYAPGHLSERDKQAWRYIAKILRPMNVVTRKDTLALEILAGAFTDYWQARQTINEKGTTYKLKDKNGRSVTRDRPEFRIMERAWIRVEKMFSHFGVTPASGGKVSVIGKLKEENPFAKFRK